MRDISEKAEFGSPSFLKMMIDGERSLSDKSAAKICDVFHIKKREKEYFMTLVHFNQCDNPDEKRRLLEQLNSLRPKITYSKEKALQARYLAHDYYACIREMVLLKDFKENAKWIAAKCLPRIKPQEARDALADLIDMGLLKRNSDGRLVQAELVLDTGREANVSEAFGFHEAVLNKARKYLSLLEQKSRDFSALTIPLDTKLEKEIRDRIYKFQNEILDLINQPGLEYNTVYQLNVQFFPVTHEVNPKDKD